GRQQPHPHRQRNAGDLHLSLRRGKRRHVSIKHTPFSPSGERGWGEGRSMTAEYQASVNQHYGRTHLIDAILDGLKAAGKDTAHLTVDDLAPVDQFHTRGRDATRELIELAGIPRGARVLDA